MQRWREPEKDGGDAVHSAATELIRRGAFFPRFSSVSRQIVSKAFVALCDKNRRSTKLPTSR